MVHGEIALSRAPLTSIEADLYAGRPFKSLPGAAVAAAERKRPRLRRPWLLLPEQQATKSRQQQDCADRQARRQQPGQERHDVLVFVQGFAAGKAGLLEQVKLVGELQMIFLREGPGDRNGYTAGRKFGLKGPGSGLLGIVLRDRIPSALTIRRRFRHIAVVELDDVRDRPVRRPSSSRTGRV